MSDRCKHSVQVKCGDLLWLVAHLTFFFSYSYSFFMAGTTQWMTAEARNNNKKPAEAVRGESYSFIMKTADDLAKEAWNKSFPIGTPGTPWKKAQDDVSILDPIGEEGKMETPPKTRNACKGKGRSVPNTPTPEEVEEICRKNRGMKKPTDAQKKKKKPTAMKKKVKNNVMMKKVKKATAMTKNVKNNVMEVMEAHKKKMLKAHKKKVVKVMKIVMEAHKKKMEKKAMKAHKKTNNVMKKVKKATAMKKVKNDVWGKIVEKVMDAHKKNKDKEKEEVRRRRKERRAQHRRYVAEICSNQGINLADVNVAASCLNGSWAIVGRTRPRKKLVTNEEKMMNKIRKLEDRVVLRSRAGRLHADEGDALSDFWYSAGRWMVFPSWISKAERKTVQEFLAR